MTKILNPLQAQVIHKAMDEFKKIGISRADLHLEGICVNIREDTLGRIVVKKWGQAAEEYYENLYGFLLSHTLAGDPGDLAIDNHNITKEPRPKPGTYPFARSRTVRRLSLKGEWKVIGHIGEHFGPDPEYPDQMVFESPNGSYYSEPWFTEAERQKVLFKWFEPMGSTWAIEDFLIEHYKTQPIPD